MIKVFIFGAGVRGKLALEIIEWSMSATYIVEGFYDDEKDKNEPGPGNKPILGTISEGLEAIKTSGYHAFIAFGTSTPLNSYNLFIKLKEKNVSLISIIPSSAHIAPSSTIGENCLIFPGVYIGTNVNIGNLFCAHGGAVIEHDSRIGDNVLLGPNASLAGGVTIGSHSFVGVGSSILPQVKIGEGVLVGGGSVVTHHIESGLVACGNPTKIIRQTNERDEVPTLNEILNYNKV
jgi:sugar O-acyltransferase (sialic acid O-acetyltransferase NeuD family)